MKRWRKLVGLGLAWMLIFSMNACGTSDKGTQKKTQSKIAEIVEEEILEKSLPDEDGETIYIYSYDSGIEEAMQYFYEKYPQYKSRVECVDLKLEPTSKEYQNTIKTMINAGNSKAKKKKAEDEDSDMAKESITKYPSIVVNDSRMGYYFMQNDYSLSMTSLGIAEEDMKYMYPYTLRAASFQDEVKGLTYHVTPGAFMYRADIAERVLGVSSPEAVQSMLQSWSGFLDVAKKMKQHGYKMLSGSDEITYAILQEKKTPWVVEEELVIDGSVRKCLQLARKLKDNQYTGDTLIQSEERLNSIESNVFGWFVSPQMFFDGLEVQSHMGDYRLCQGPTAYQWGGTYLTVSPKCPDKELAALVLKTICLDEEVLTKMAEKNFVNNRTIMRKRMKKAEPYEILGKQNAWYVWSSVVDNIDSDVVTPYDGRFDGWIQDISRDYNTEKIDTIEEAIDLFKDEVIENFNYIKME